MAKKPTLVTINILTHTDNGGRDLDHIARELDILDMQYVWKEREIKSKSELRRLSSQLNVRDYERFLERKKL